jgi:hypothetical protein
MDENDINQLKKENEWFRKQYGPYIEKRGMNNWKNLFRKPSLYEWTILFMLIMGLFMGWAYQRDIAVCREYINQQESYYNLTYNLGPNPSLLSNLSNFSLTIKEETNEYNLTNSMKKEIE